MSTYQPDRMSTDQFTREPADSSDAGIRQLSGAELVSLRRLLDREAILDCLNRYARGVDRGDTDLAMSAYHADAIEDHGAYIGDLEGLARYLASVHRPFTGYQRYVTNITLDIDDDEAHCESYFLCVLRHDGASKLFVSGGRYIDRFERRPDPKSDDGEPRWAIANRVVVLEWHGETTGSAPDPAGHLAGTHDLSDVSYQRPLAITREHRTPPARSRKPD